MMRSLFAGVSGLKTHQTRMDVIGNNIANVNTVAYKSQNVTFQDLLYQTTQSASGANADTGRAGINAKQIGLGVKQGAINTAIATQGASQTTGNPFDIAISGDAFFIVSDGSSNYFTRAGAFTVDANGTLCMTTNGYTVQGWTNVDEAGNVQKNSVAPLNIMKKEYLTQDPEITTDGYFTGIIDANDPSLDPSKGVISTISFYDNKGYSYTLKTAVTKEAGDGPGEYTMSAVDLLDGNGKSVLTVKNMQAAGVAGITGPAADGKYTIGSETYEANDAVPASMKASYLSDCKLFSGNNVQKLIYDTQNGKWAGADKTFSLDLTTKLANDLDPAMTKNITVDLSTTKNVDNDGSSTIGGKNGNIANSALGAGRAVGEMDSISIQTDGKIFASYTNGVTKCLGQIAVAEFANASGLEKAGENLYRSTQNSGSFDGVGVDISASGGAMASGTLEMSNVDLSSEFTDMITTQRGFQANSRIITVSDTLLEELINLKR